MEPQADIALIGLAVMGQNFILNMNDHGFTVVAFNRTVEKVDHFLANEAKGTKVIGAHSLSEMVSALKKPRRVMMLVKAGKAVDEFIEHLLPHWNRATSSLTAAIRCSRTPIAARNMSRARGCFTSAPA
jgi:6-phosphogluconate dehydrogenase